MLSEVALRVAVPFSAGSVRRIAARVLRSLGRRAAGKHISIAFVGNAEMRRLNRRYHHSRGTTDVLAFPGNGDLLGEVIISVPEMQRQARRYGHAALRETETLLVHGMLHLGGYGHETPAARRRMQREEQRILRGSSLIHRTQTTV